MTRSDRAELGLPYFYCSVYSEKMSTFILFKNGKSLSKPFVLVTSQKYPISPRDSKVVPLTSRMRALALSQRSLQLFARKLLNQQRRNVPDLVPLLMTEITMMYAHVAHFHARCILLPHFSLSRTLKQYNTHYS